MSKKWYKDVLYFLYAVLVTILTFSMIMETDSALHVGAVVIVGIVCILFLSRSDLEHFYLKIGDRVELGAREKQEEAAQVEIEEEN